MTIFIIIKRDLTLALRNLSELFNPLLFFVVVVTLFSLATSASPNTLTPIAAGVIWVAALLSTLLSLDRLFKDDFLDGSLEQLIQSQHSFYLIVLGKIIAHWLIAGLPLIIITPLLAVLLFLPSDAQIILLATLILGTPTLSLIGAIGVGLTVGLNQGGVLLSLLVLPLYVPVLIIGSMAVNEAIAGLPVTAHLYILAAIFTLALTLTPFATAAAIKISIE